MTREPDRPVSYPALSDVTPSMYPKLTLLERKLTERHYRRLSKGQGRGIYAGALDTPRRAAQLAYTYGTYATLRIAAAPFIVVGVVVATLVGNVALRYFGLLVLVIGLGVSARLIFRARQVNAYFRRTVP